MDEKKEIKIGLKTAIFCIFLFITLIIGMVWEAVYKYHNKMTTENAGTSIKIVGVSQKY